MSAGRQLLIGLATLLVIGVVVLDLSSFLGWPASGPVAVVAVLATHLTIVALVIGVAVAFLGGTGVLRAALVVLVALTFLRFGGEWLSIPDGTPETTPRIRVATWNLEVGGRPVPDTIAFLRSMPADVVAIQELTPDVSAAIAADPGLAVQFPFQSLSPSSDVLGLGILSRFPLSSLRFERDPSRSSAMADTPIGRVRLANVHPLHDEIPRLAGLPIGYETTARDTDLDTIRGDLVSDGATDPTVILGDINTAPTEPAFGRFTTGLRDAHAEVGTGPGWTYRPDALEALGMGLIRIDVVLTGPGLRPIAESTACPTQGDHCAVLATVVADPG